MFRTLSVTLLALVLMFSPAYAVEINDEGEQKLRALFTDLINDQKSAFNKENSELQTDGEIIIEQADDYYSITLPKLVYKIGEQQKVILGFISVNAVPTKDPQNWKMSFTMPSTIHFIGKKGQKAGKMNLGKQKMQGIWNMDLNSFSKFKAQYNDIAFLNHENKTSAFIDKIEMMGKLEEKDGKWSGPSRSMLKDFRIKKDDQNIFSIDAINADVQLVNYDPANRKIMIQKLEEANAQNKEVDLSEIMKLYGSDYTINMSMDNVIGNISANKNKKESTNFSMEEAVFKMKSESTKTNKINYELQLGYDGLKASDLDKYAPSKFNIDLAMKNIPVKEIREMASGMNISRDNPNSAKIAALQGMITLPQILSKAQTTLKIKNTGVSNDNYNLDINGDFNATATSPIGVVGDMKLKIEGLDKIVTDLEKEKEGAEPSKISKINSTLKNIQAIQLFSEKKSNTDMLHLTMGEDGKTLINGKDISLLMGQR